MREISLAAPDDRLPINNFLIYGDSRAGKTTFLASFPRPIILADATEKGWESLIDYPEDKLFEPGIKPRVIAIENMADMAQARAQIAPLIASKQCLTVGIDSITFYADMYLAGLFGAQSKPDNRKAYGDLGVHLRDLRVKTHGLGANSAWLALAKHPEDDNPSGGPQIPGQQASKLAASTDYIFYARHEQPKAGVKLLDPIYEMRTKKYGAYVAGNRLGGRAEKLPDPLVGTYTDFLTHLGYDVVALRASLPKYGTVAMSKPIVTAPPIAAKPVAIIKPVVKPTMVVRPTSNTAPPSASK